MKSENTATHSFSVPAVSCSHCQATIAQAISALGGVDDVDVDLWEKRVSVSGGTLDEAAIRAAIERAGYAVEP